jgi:branched-subunit amino acid ABC-type transport system permease component
LAGALAGIAGVTTAATVGAISPLMALPVTIKGLIAAVVGGLSSLRGAIFCGLAIGVLEAISLQFIGVTYRDATVLLLLFAFLIFRPRGLFATAAVRNE